jgi:hypothetical protein
LHIAPPGRTLRKMSDHDIGELARARGAKALDVLEEVMEDPIAEDRDRVRAAEALLDRGYGKAAQAIIAVPAARRQAALLASMSDEQLVAIIEQKQLPRIGAPQPMVTIGARPQGFATVVMSGHGPAEEAYAAEPQIDPLLE